MEAKSTDARALIRFRSKTDPFCRRRACATSSGRFEIDFVGLGETGPYLQFTEQTTWNPRALKYR
jgi:hypothetical protein